MSNGFFNISNLNKFKNNVSYLPHLNDNNRKKNNSNITKHSEHLTNINRTSMCNPYRNNPGINKSLQLDKTLKSTTVTTAANILTSEEYFKEVKKLCPYN